MDPEANFFMERARSAGAQLLVTSEISFARVKTAGYERTASVGLKVLVYEVSSGELVNGAAEIGTVTTSRQPDYSGAVKAAVERAVRHIQEYSPVEGTISSMSGHGGSPTILVVGLPKSHGLKRGMEMPVLRDGQRVARLRVENVYPTDIEASEIENTNGIRPTDIARLIFTMPEFSPPLREPDRAAMERMEWLRWQ